MLFASETRNHCWHKCSKSNMKTFAFNVGLAKVESMIETSFTYLLVSYELTVCAKVEVIVPGFLLICSNERHFVT